VPPNRKLGTNTITATARRDPSRSAPTLTLITHHSLNHRATPRPVFAPRIVGQPSRLRHVAAPTHEYGRPVKPERHTRAEIVEHLRASGFAVHVVGDHAYACCPAHDDHKPSLTVSASGWITCHAEIPCSYLDVLAVIGLGPAVARGHATRPIIDIDLVREAFTAGREHRVPSEDAVIMLRKAMARFKVIAGGVNRARTAKGCPAREIDDLVQHGVEAMLEMLRDDTSSALAWLLVENRVRSRMSDRRPMLGGELDWITDTWHVVTTDNTVTVMATAGGNEVNVDFYDDYNGAAPTIGCNPLDAYLAQELHREVWEAVDEYRAADWPDALTFVHAHYIDGLPLAVVAKALGTSVSTLKRRWQTMRAALASNKALIAWCGLLGDTATRSRKPKAREVLPAGITLMVRMHNDGREHPVVGCPTFAGPITVRVIAPAFLAQAA
jgi:DNA-directed RNA polymerase specialized sigma24 family protein